MVSVRAGDVHNSMDLDNRFPAVCGALNTDLFRGQIKGLGVEEVETTGPPSKQSSTTTFHYKIL